jgi:hypothetical protein
MDVDVPRWRWFDSVLTVVVVAALSCAGWVVRAQIPESADDCCADTPPCEKGAGGDCGCEPAYPPCSMPCSGCCPGGCKAPPPSPTRAE